MMEIIAELFAGLFILGGFYVLFTLAYCRFLDAVLDAVVDQDPKELRKTPTDQSIYVRYPDHTVEEMQVHDVCDMEKALRKHLTNKLAAAPDTDVSLMLVYWLSLDGYAKLRLYSVDPNPGGVPFFSTAVSSSIDFDWDHKIAALKNPDVQLDAICALGCRLQDAEQNTA